MIRLYGVKVDETLIAEKTGLKSNSTHAYNHTSESEERAMSTFIPGNK